MITSMLQSSLFRLKLEKQGQVAQGGWWDGELWVKWLLRTRSYKDFNIRSPVQLQLSHYPTLLHLFVSGHCVVMNNGINHAGTPWGAFLAEMLGTLFRSCLVFFFGGGEITGWSEEQIFVWKPAGAFRHPSYQCPCVWGEGRMWKQWDWTQIWLVFELVDLVVGSIGYGPCASSRGYDADGRWVPHRHLRDVCMRTGSHN